MNDEVKVAPMDVPMFALTWEDIREIAALTDEVRSETSDDYLLSLPIPERIENEHREYREILRRFVEYKKKED